MGPDRLVSGHVAEKGAARSGGVSRGGDSNADLRERLAILESRFAESQQAAHVGSWEWNLADDVQWWSDELYRIFGFQPRSFQPTFDSFVGLIPPEDLQSVRAVIQQARETPVSFELEHRIVRPDGEMRVVHARCKVIRDDAGGVLRMVGTAQDVTQRKTAEDVLARSERRLQTIVDAEPACVKLVSPEGVLIDMNRAGLEMLGATDLSQVRGRAVIELVHPADRSRYQAMHCTVAAGAKASLEFRIVGLDGRERWLHSQAVPFDTPSGGAPARSAVLAVTSDVTERKSLEERLRQVQKLEAVGLLAGGIAHDFNNLLTAISGFTEVVMATFDQDDPRRADLLEVRKAGIRAASLTAQLLAFGRRQILHFKVIDLNALVADVHKLLRRTIPEHITVAMELCPVLDNIRADAGQLHQVLMNLAVNAADAMPGGGRLTFATDTVDVDQARATRQAPMPPGRYVRLSVSDTGSGMPPETEAHIFEPFFTTKEGGRGSGLGLASVYGIVKQSGGFIWVATEVGRGTTFELYLPAVAEPVDTQMPLSAEAPRGGPETILLADDDGAVRRLARDVLRRYGYEVLEARDGDEALAMAEQHEGAIHLLVTDVVMPGLSGRELARRLRVLRPEMRILYSSGYSGRMSTAEEDIEQTDLLPKPYPPTALLHRVRDTLDGR